VFGETRSEGPKNPVIGKPFRNISERRIGGFYEKSKTDIVKNVGPGTCPLNSASKGGRFAPWGVLTAHVKENAVALSLTLTPQELQTLDAAHPLPSATQDQ